MQLLRVALVVLAGCGRVEISDPPADAGADTAVLRCQDRPGVLFCDDFEDTSLAAWPTRYGAAARQSAIVHGGSGALRVTSNTPQEPAGVGAFPFDGFSTGELHLRAWFYVPGTPAALSKINLFEIYRGPSDGVTFLVDQSALVTYVAPGARTIAANMVMPRERWFCLELHVIVDDAAGALRIDVDGAEKASSTGFATRPTGGYNSVDIGTLFLATDQPPVTLYIDDVSIGTQAHGCS